MHESLHEQWDTKKISSRSKEDFDSVQKEREREEKEKKYEISNSEIFGTDTLEELKSVNRLIHKTEPSNDQRSENGSKIENSDHQHHTSLEIAAHEAPEEVNNIFFEYLNTFEDIDAVAKKMGINYSNNEKFEEEAHRRLRDKKQTKGMTAETIKRKIIIEDLAHILTKKSRSSNFDTQDIPIIVGALEKHHHEMVAKERKMQQEIPEMMQKFEKKIKKAMEDGLFPIDPEVLQERLQMIRFNIIDPIESKIKEKVGDFKAGTLTVRLLADTEKTKESPNFFRKILHFFSNKDDDTKFSTFSHEIFHGLSGQSKMVKINREYTDIKGYTISRVGLSIDKEVSELGSEEAYAPSFIWLNEALTEQAALDLLEKKESKAYEPERQLLNILIAKGLSRETLYKAYFDNYTIREPGEHRTPALKELFIEANKIFGDRFLINLDRYILFYTDQTGSDARGVGHAVEAWKTEGANFPQFLETWSRERRGKK